MRVQVRVRRHLAEVAGMTWHVLRACQTFLQLNWIQLEVIVAMKMFVDSSISRMHAQPKCVYGISVQLCVSYFCLFYNWVSQCRRVPNMYANYAHTNCKYLPIMRLLNVECQMRIVVNTERLGQVISGYWVAGWPRQSDSQDIAMQKPQSTNGIHKCTDRIWLDSVRGHNKLCGNKMLHHPKPQAITKVPVTNSICLCV